MGLYKQFYSLEKRFPHEKNKKKTQSYIIVKPIAISHRRESKTETTLVFYLALTICIALGLVYRIPGTCSVVCTYTELFY